LAFFIVFLTLTTTLFSQNKSDIGLLFGTSYYQGDMNPTTRFYSPSFAAGINYRYNINSHFVIKSELNYLRLSASDADFTNDVFQANLRRGTFQSNVYDLSGQCEFNFLPLKFRKQKISFSPYVSSGLAGAIVLMSTIDAIPKFVLPFDIGVRISVWRKWSIGAQWSFRKTFTDDKFDGVVNPFNSEMTSLFNNNDWYSFAGIFLTYKIFDVDGSCPAYTGDGHGLNLYK
jgi:hypothetical protein